MPSKPILSTPKPHEAKPYVGRFAPSPTGPLHMGSLVCALASYLDAKAHHGKWLLRIEDIDKPREQAGASEAIIHALLTHGLHWDDSLTYQSHNSQRYDKVLTFLQDMQMSYRCSCTRKRLTKFNPGYDGYCKNRNISEETPHALRLDLHTASKRLEICETINVIDRIQAPLNENLSERGDFMIRRKDGLYSYHLAVVVDDIDQCITDVVRGNDLHDCTPHQIFLTQTLGESAVRYAHIPVICFNDGKKLSKQHHAPAIEPENAAENLYEALRLLQLAPPTELGSASIETILSWGIEHWQTQQLNEKPNIII
ncbi:MAG: tRNA glutamyl-Q(34) synthetase GluQRS [Agarilytica sp.]